MIHSWHYCIEKTCSIALSNCFDIDFTICFKIFASILQILSSVNTKIRLWRIAKVQSISVVFDLASIWQIHRCKNTNIICSNTYTCAHTLMRTATLRYVHITTSQCEWTHGKWTKLNQKYIKTTNKERGRHFDIFFLSFVICVRVYVCCIVRLVRTT